MVTAGFFEVERDGDVLVVTPRNDPREFEYQDIEAQGRGVLDRLGEAGLKGAVLDLGRTDYFGSTAVGFFLRLWERVSDRGGRMALCNVSGHEREVLAVTRLDSLWPVCRSREEAIKAVTA